MELAEIISFVFLVLFKDGGCKVSPRFHLFVFNINQGKEDGEMWGNTVEGWGRSL